VWLYVLVAVLLLVTIAVQVFYVRTYSAQITNATRVIMYVNIGLLAALLLAISWFAYSRGVG
jgi:hypothetical protein